MAAQVSRPSFSQRVYHLVQRVSEGRVVTYGQIAVALEEPHAARTVGWAMRHSPANVPWWRVVGAGGRILTADAEPGVYRQRALLENEGVTFDEKGNVHLSHHGMTQLEVWSLALAGLDHPKQCPGERIDPNQENHSISRSIQR